MEAEEVEPEESSSELSIDPALHESVTAGELSRRQGALEHLKQHHKRGKPKRPRLAADMKAEVLRVLEEDTRRQAMFQRQADFPGVGIGYCEDENGGLIKRKLPGKDLSPEALQIQLQLQLLFQEKLVSAHPNHEPRGPGTYPPAS